MSATTSRSSTLPPPPWNLACSGYLVFARLPPGRPDLRWFGIVMFLEYASSPVGPYEELLYAPGRHRWGGRGYWTIERIYVSTSRSVQAGRRIWGIPKEQAAFTVTRRAEGGRVEVSVGGRPVAEFEFSAHGRLWPLCGTLLPPSWRTLAQPAAHGRLLTTPVGRGAVRPARVAGSWVADGRCPGLGPSDFLAALEIQHARAMFPAARAHRSTRGGTPSEAPRRVQ